MLKKSQNKNSYYRSIKIKLYAIHRTHGRHIYEVLLHDNVIVVLNYFKRKKNAEMEQIIKRGCGTL